MSKIVVIGGAGGMGSEAVKDLAINETFDEIVIADANLEAAKKVLDETKSERVSIVQIDVNDMDGLLQLFKGATVVLNFVGPFYKYGPSVIRAAMNAKVHYVDICDDYDAAVEILAMNEEVKKAGITVLTGMGSSPGITNVLARMGIDELDETEEIDTMWVMGEAKTGAAILYHVFHAGSGLVPGFENGQRTMIKPFDEKRALTIEFPEPLGKVKVYDIGHPEPITIPHYFPKVKKVTNKGSLVPEKIVDTFISFLKLGFHSTETVEINKNIHISPRDFAVKYLQQNPQLLEAENSPGFGGLKVIVKGLKDGQKVSYIYTTMSSESTGESTGIPAAVGAELIAKGKITQRGVIAPEVLDPKLVLSSLGRRKRVNNDIKTSGLMIERINPDGTKEIIRGNRLNGY